MERYLGQKEGSSVIMAKSEKDLSKHGLDWNLWTDNIVNTILNDASSYYK